MRLVWLSIALVMMLPSAVCFADETNTTGNTDSKVISELGKKALAHLQRQYPHIEVGRFMLISRIRSLSNTSGDAVVPITYADKTSLKRFGCREPASGRLTEVALVWKDSYTVLIRLDGKITSVFEEHLSDKQALSLVSRHPRFQEPDDRILELPKLLMGDSN
jgi:hypothetical protein